MRIAVADHHQIIRRGLQLIVARRSDWAITAEAESIDQLLAALSDGVPFDILVTDLSLRGRCMLEALEQVHALRPALPVLILTSQPEEQYAVAALRAGARGYIQKDASADEIIDAISRVASGRTRVSESITEQLAQGLTSAVPLHDRLSGRELDVFLRLARGESVGDIAAALGVSIKTVSTYRTRILEKSGFRSNADIVAYAVRNGLLA
jgi:two-component system, NarL family, invasion response regulator UvrY